MNGPAKTKALVLGALLLCGMAVVIVKISSTDKPRRDHAAPPLKFAGERPAVPEQTRPFSGPDAPELADFSSEVPIIVLRTEWPGPVSRSKSYSSFRMEVYEPKGNTLARVADGPSLTTPVGLRLHGMVSRQFPKLSYRLQLQDENAESRAQPLLGMPGSADWVLQGPWLDKSLIRNAFSYDLARAMGCSGMRTRPCEVFLSTAGHAIREGDYVGVYQLTEQIERGPERVDVMKLGAEENSEEAISGGYILACDVGEGKYLPSWKTIQLKYPKRPSRAQIAWIDRALVGFDRALKGPDFREPAKGYAAHIDVDAWVNYILFEELVFNLDAYCRSFYLQKERGGLIRPGPVWDHDLALGHQFPGGTRFTQWWFVERYTPHQWIPRLMEDPAFVSRMAERWAGLRRDVLSNTRMDARIDAIAAPLLPGAAERNFQRWKILNVKSPFREVKYLTYATKTYPEQIAALKEFLHQRAEWMDARLSPQPGK